MAKKIYEASELPEKEEVWLVKDSFGWRIINPVKNPKTGKINMMNLFFGGKRNMINLFAILALLALLLFGTWEMIESYKDAAENPCDYCKESTLINPDVLKDLGFGKIPNNTNFSLDGDEIG